MKKLAMYLVLMCALTGLVSALSIEPSVVSLGDPSQEKSNPDEKVNIHVTKSFTVQAGTTNLTNVVVSSEAVLTGKTGYNVTFRADSGDYLSSVNLGDLNTGEQQTVTVKVRVDEGHDAYPDPSVFIGRIRAIADGVSAVASDMRLETRNKLEIKRVYVQINDQSRKRYDNNDDVEDIKPGDKITIEVVVENKYSNSADVDFEDVEVEIESDNSDFDADETLDYGDVNADDEETKSYSFTVDDDIDEDTYVVTFTLIADDKYGSRHGEIWTIDFEVKKEDEDIAIKSASFSQESVKCNRETTFSVRLENIGDDSSDEVVLHVENAQLGIDKRFIGIELDDGDEYFKTIPITIDDDVRAGTYSVEVKTYFDFDNFEDRVINNIKLVDLKVESCIETITCYSCVNGQVASKQYQLMSCPAGESLTVPRCEVEEPEEPEGPIEPEEPTEPTPAPVTVKPSRTDILYFVLIALGYVVVIAVIIALISYVVRRK